MSLNNSGIYYNLYYIHGSEVNATSWINENTGKKHLVLDSYSKLRFSDYPFINHFTIDPVLAKNESGYIYLDYTNVTKGLYAIFLNGNIIEYKFINQNNNQNLVYSNKYNLVYKNN